MRVEYSSNNSGGSWWLTDNNWRDLEAAGWKVDWFAQQDREFFKADSNGKWLGALASNATREGLSLGDAVDEWERVTGESSNDLGCSCCGAPHSFSAYDDDGNDVDYYSPSFPSSGSRYGE